MDLYKEIRQLRLEGKSQRQIAQQLRISRHTVKKYGDGNAVPWERKGYEREASIITDKVLAFIRSCLDEDEQTGRKKQRHTAKRIYDRLVEEQNFRGGASTIRKIVRELREKAGEAYVPLHFPAGDALQVDWGEAVAYVEGEKITVNLFCARLCYSSAPIVFAYRRQNEESFLEALTRVFTYFGGVTRKVIFDNAKIAVKDGFGAHARKQDGYARLAAHYGFEAVFCNVQAGHEKGLVEGLVGYIRRNVCVPVPKVATLEELDALLLQRCQSYLTHHIRSKEAPVGMMLEQEKQALRPLPGYPLDTAKRTHVRVDRYSTVRFDTNNYSVPVRFCGREVTLKATPEKIVVLHAQTVIAEHTRCYHRKQFISILEHYLPLLAQKGRALAYAKPLLDHAPSDFLTWLYTQDLSPKQITELLARCQTEGYASVMNHALPVSSLPMVDVISVPPVDLSVYDALYSAKAGVH